SAAIADRVDVMSGIAHWPRGRFFLRWPREDRGIGLAELRVKTLLALIGVLAILVAIAAAVFFFGGFYNVAATVADPDSVKWALVQVRLASLRRHALDTPSVSLEDPAMVQAGARAFSERGCVNCHGAPGVNWAKFSEGLRPDPPDLKDLVN